MGARGPRRELPAIKKARGNPGKRKITDSGIVASGSPFVLEYLSDYARGVVETVVRSMPPGTYSAADSYDLGAFAVEVEKHRTATLMISAVRAAFERVDTGEVIAEWNDPLKLK